MTENKPQTPSPLTVAFGRQIAAERTAKGYSLREFAAMTGISPESLHRYEKGKRDAPLKAVGLIANALGMTGAQLVALAELRADRDAANS